MKRQHQLPERSLHSAVATVLVAALAWTPVGTVMAAPGSSTSPSDGTRSDAKAGEAAAKNEEGRALYEEQKFAEAAEAFSAAYALSGDANLLYNISVCFDRAGELEQALDYLDQYIEQAPEEELSDLRRDRTVLEERIAARTASAETPAAGPAPAVSVEPASGSEPPNDNVPKRVVTPAAGIALGVGAVGVMVGAGLGLASIRAASEVDTECSGEPAICRQGGPEAQERSEKTALGADISFGIGAAGLLTGVVIIAVNAVRRKKAKERGLAISPTRNGVLISGRF